MTKITDQELLPVDAGTRPWLYAREGVPVLWEGDESKVFGHARVWASDEGSLMCEIELTPEGDGIRRMVESGQGDVSLRYGVHGKIEREHYDEVDGVPLRVIDEVAMRAISVSQEVAFDAGSTRLRE